MDQPDVQSLISLSTFLAGAGSAAFGMVKWYANSQKKAYAAERDFNHLRRNQEQMKESIKMLSEEVDELMADMKTLTAVFNVLLAKTDESVSSILGYEKKHGSSGANDD